MHFTLGRPAGFALDGGHAVSYAYDMYGRFHSVSSSVTSAYTYGYLDGSDLLSGMTASSGFLRTRAYESGRSLVTSVENRFGETVISRYDYAYDALGRRTSRADSGEAFTITNANDLAAFNLYGYNGRSEVASAARYWGTDTRRKWGRISTLARRAGVPAREHRCNLIPQEACATMRGSRRQLRPACHWCPVPQH